jgi:hypothetical protein
MAGGRDARTMRGRPNPPRPDDYGRSGSPSYPSARSNVGGVSVRKGAGMGATVTVSRPPDVIDRAVRVRTSASSRTDSYGDFGPSWTTGGPAPDGKSRAPRSYTDPGRQT